MNCVPIGEMETFLTYHNKSVYTRDTYNVIHCLVNLIFMFRCGEMGWVDWEMTDLDGGYMYCCDLQEAAAAFKEISSLNLGPSSGLIQLP